MGRAADTGSIARPHEGVIVFTAACEVALDAGALAKMSWEEATRVVAHAMFDAIRRHQNLGPLLIEQLPMGPNAMAHRERCIAILLDNGFPPPVAARAYAVLARYVLGFAIQFEAPTAAGRRADALAAARFRAADPSRFPATVAVAGSLPVPLEDEFAFGLELILKGLGA